MDLYVGTVHSRQRVAQSDARVRVRTGVDEEAVRRWSDTLDVVDQLAFTIGVEGCDGGAEAGAKACQLFHQLGQGGAAIDIRLALSEQAQVGAVDDGDPQRFRLRSHAWKDSRSSSSSAAWSEEEGGERGSAASTAAAPGVVTASAGGTEGGSSPGGRSSAPVSPASGAITPGDGWIVPVGSSQGKSSPSSTAAGKSAASMSSPDATARWRSASRASRMLAAAASLESSGPCPPAGVASASAASATGEKEGPAGSPHPRAGPPSSASAGCES